jgi:hypothetical protein
VRAANRLLSIAPCRAAVAGRNIPTTMKTFTLANANRTLPLVSRIVRDLVARYPRWRELVNEFELMTASQRADAPDPRVADLERQVSALAREIDGYILEITELGAEVRNPLDSGLVDFPGMHDGRPIFLCWQLGEETIEHWHERDGGFAGRQPIDALAFADR